MSTNILDELEPELRATVETAVRFRLRAIDGVLVLLEQMLRRREITPLETAITVTYVAENFAVLQYSGGFFWASFLYTEADNVRHIVVLDAEHISSLVTGFVVIPDQQFTQGE